MNNKKYIIAGLLGLLVIGVIVALYMKFSAAGPDGSNEMNNQEVSTDEPVDIVLDFYLPWLNAVKSTSTNPYASGLADEKILSAALSARLISTEGHAETDIDPVLCQTTKPTRVSGRIVSKTDTEARVLVVAKEKELTAQSVFTLKRFNDGWFIDDILCTPGEFELPREFSFEKEGYLLKSVPPPFDPQYWHIVFEENGELGHVAPLYFDAETACVSVEKSTAVCSPDQFMETSKVHVFGQMTERGVEVKRLEFVQ